jgi:hypothetical protein
MTLTLALPIAAWAQKEAKSKGEITNRTAACKNDRSIAGDGSAGQSVEVRGVPADTRLEAVLRRHWGSVTACTGSTREGGHHSAQRSDSSLVRSSRMGVQSLPISKSRRNSGSRWLAGVVNVQNHRRRMMHRNPSGNPNEASLTKPPVTLSRSEEHVNRVLSRIQQKRQHTDGESAPRYFEPEDGENMHAVWMKR